MMAELEYKIADTDAEYDAIHRLNYQTFVEEIPQHERNSRQQLVDKFHHENTYFICKQGQRVLAMIAGRTARPFSLDSKVAQLDDLLPANSYPVEVRLLVVEPSCRKTKICGVLIEKLSTHYAALGRDIALISATLRESRLYRRMGFEPFGPIVGRNQALYQPMFLTLGKYLSLADMLNKIKSTRGEKLNLHPGPVTIAPYIENAFIQKPISHRSAAFTRLYQDAVNLLVAQTGMNETYIFQGAGTMANEIIAAQLSQYAGQGLILVNGEFGERLAEQARRWQLDFDVLSVQWGSPLNLEAISKRLSSRKDQTRWIWFVGLETATGVRNPYREIIALAKQFNVKACVDAISLIGTEPTHFKGASLVSGTSGKGVGGYAGLCFIAQDEWQIAEQMTLPSYLDLAHYQQRSGIPFTLSSNLLMALHASLAGTNWSAKYERLRQGSVYFFNRCNELGIELVNKRREALSCVFTIRVPEGLKSTDAAAQLSKSGYDVYFETQYLLDRNWLQVSLYSLQEIADIYNLPLLLQGCFAQQLAQKSRA